MSSSPQGRFILALGVLLVTIVEAVPPAPIPPSPPRRHKSSVEVFCNTEKFDPEWWRHYLYPACAGAVTDFELNASSDSYTVVADRGIQADNPILQTYFVNENCAFTYYLSEGVTTASLPTEYAADGAYAVLDTCGNLGYFMLNDDLKIQIITRQKAIDEARVNGRPTVSHLNQ